VSNPISFNDDGIKIKPEKMEKEKLYHCLFKGKVVLFYKDAQEILNCFEIEDTEIVDAVKNSKDQHIEKLLEDYIEKNKLKH